MIRRILSSSSKQCKYVCVCVCFYPVYSDPAVHALQFLDVIAMKDPSQKSNFFRSTLPEVLPYIPRVSGRDRD